MKNKPDTTTLSLRIPTDLKTDLETIAEEETRSLNNLINIVLKQYVKAHHNS